MSNAVKFCPKCHQPVEGSNCPYCGTDVAAIRSTNAKHRNSEIKNKLVLVMSVAIGLAFGLLMVYAIICFAYEVPFGTWPINLTV